MTNKGKGKGKKRVVAIGKNGQAHITSTFNNLVITITNEAGDTITWSSAGKMGFKGSKKNTPYAAQVTSTECAKAAYALGLRQLEVFVRYRTKGPGIGRESAIRALQENSLEIMSIRDVTPLPHNGCRPPKRRRP